MQIPSTPLPILTKKITLLQALQFTVLACLILYWGQSVFIPLSFSLLISCFLYPFCAWMEKKGMSKAVAVAISISALVVLSLIAVFLLFQQISTFVIEWNQLKLKLSNTLSDLNIFLESKFTISIEQQQEWIKNFIGNTGNQIIPFFSSTIYSVSLALVLFFLIPVLSALILYYRHLFINVLYRLLPDEKSETILEILKETIHTYYNFIKGMLLVYLIVGILNSLGLALLGIPHAVLFGFMTAILTFIPYIGIMVGSFFPITIAWITYNSIWYPLGVILVFGFVQYLEANVIFPFVVSSRMKLNALVTIVAVMLGGILWGAAGLILFVPFLGMLKLIADKSDRLKVLSLMLGTSENGKKNK